MLPLQSPLSRRAEGTESICTPKSKGQDGKKREKNYLPRTLPKPLSLSRSPRRLTRIRVLRLGIRALAAMDGGGGGGAEGELTAQETALYDRQIRVWGVDAQKRCAALKNSTFAIVIISLLFSIHLNFCSILLFFQARVGYFIR